MRFACLSALKDLRRFRRDPVAILVWVGIPAFIGLMMIVLFGRGEIKPQGLLLVADEDGSFLSSMISSAYDRGELGNMLDVERVEQADGRRRMERGEASALLVIPKGFSSGFLRSEPAQLLLYTNPAQQIIPEIIREATAILVEAGSYVQLLAGDQLRVFSAGPPSSASTFPDQTIAAASVAFNSVAREASAWLDPPRIEIATKVVERQAQKFDFRAAFFPSTLSLSILFLAFGLSGKLWQEREGGTLRRAATTPGGVTALLTGMLLAFAAVAAAAGTIGLLIARFVLGLRLHNPATAVLWLAACGVVMHALMLLVQVHAGNARAGNILANLILFPLAILGGSMFPFEMMPAAFVRIARLTPNGWALQHFRDFLNSPASLSETLAAFTLLSLAGAALIWLLARRLRTCFVL